MELEIDEALDTVGGFRRWNIAMFFLVGMSMFMNLAWHGLIFVFSSWEPPHRCRSALLDKTSNLSSSSTWTNVTTDKCFMIFGNSSEKEPCRYGWEYDNGEYLTLIQQFNLVCDRNYLAELSQTLLLVGYLVSSLAVAPLVDRFGRKPVYLCGQLLVGVIGLGIAFAHSLTTFIALRALLGLVLLMNYGAAYTYLLELYDTKRRAKVGIGVELPWIVCYMVLALMAYLIKDWRHLQILISCASFFWIPFIVFFPESPQWLAVVGRKSEAEMILSKIAAWNRVDLPEGGIKLLSSYKPRDKTSNSDAIADQTMISVITNDQGTVNCHTSSINTLDNANGLPESYDNVALTCTGSEYSLTSSKSEQEISAKVTDTVGQEEWLEKIPYYKLFTNSNLLLTLIVCNCLWFANCFIYYGLILATPSLAGNRFVNFALMGLMEVPACLLTFYTTDRFGRRITTCIYHIMSGLPLAVYIFIPKTTSTGTDLSSLLITLVMISKFGISASFSIVIVYVREIYPTALRSTGNGIGSIAGAIGSMVAPFCAYAGKTSLYWLPNVMYGGIALLVGILVLLLPETAGLPMPQSLADLDLMFKSRRFNYFPKGFKEKLCFMIGYRVKKDTDFNTNF